MAPVRSTRITVFALVTLGLPLAFPAGANAALIDRGGGLIYDDDLDITWLANANAGAGSAFDDGFSSTDGFMTWQAAMNWVADFSYVDTVRGVTWTDWRLPDTLQPDPACADQNGNVFSSGLNCTGAELGHMFYAELGGTGFSPISSSNDPDKNLFTNLLSDGYWSRTEYAPDPGPFAYVLNFGYGLQAADQKSIGYYAWAVRDGDVAVVPAPGALWLLGTGCVGLLGWKRWRATA